MNKLWSLLFMGIFILLSCRTQKKPHIIKQYSPPKHHQLVQWTHFNTIAWNNRSFPNWFASDLIDSFQINTIQLEFINCLSSDSMTKTTTVFPYKSMTFFFNEKGTIKKIKENHFNNGIRIVEQTFSYPNAIDSFGYTTPTMTSVQTYNDKKEISFLTTLQSLASYNRLELKEKTNNYLYFEGSQLSRTDHVFILDSLNWNVTYIDNHFSPTENKIFYYGSPLHFATSFYLKNLVEKTPIIQQKRYPNGVLKKQIFFNADFKTIRTFSFDSLGICTGFSDSLMTNANEFLKVKIGTIEYQNNYPITLSIYENQSQKEKKCYQKIQFKYN